MILTGVYIKAKEERAAIISTDQCRSATPTSLLSTLQELSCALALAFMSCLNFPLSYVCQFIVLSSFLTVQQEVLARVGIRGNASGDPANGTNGVQAKPASSSRISTLPHYSQPNATVNEYLVGTQLDEALAAGQDILISWPFADGDVRDWTQAEAIWYAISFFAPSILVHAVLGNM